MDTTGKRIRNCRPLLYLRLLTQRVRDPLAQICSHNRLIGQFSHSAQPLNSRIKDQKSDLVFQGKLHPSVLAQPPPRLISSSAQHLPAWQNWSIPTTWLPGG